MPVKWISTTAFGVPNAKSFAGFLARHILFSPCVPGLARLKCGAICNIDVRALQLTEER